MKEGRRQGAMASWWGVEVESGWVGVEGETRKGWKRGRRRATRSEDTTLQRRFLLHGKREVTGAKRG